MHPPGISADEYRSRQRRLLEQLPTDAILIIPNNPVAKRSNDVDHPYRSNSNLLYLTGWTEADAVLTAHHEDGEWILTMFVPPRDTIAEIWTGIRPGVEGTLEDYPIDRCHANNELSDRLAEMLRRSGKVAYARGVDPLIDSLVDRIMTERTRDRQRYGKGPVGTIDPTAPLAEMRLRKSKAEIDLIREAGSIAAEAHCRAMRAAHAGIGEHSLRAAIEGWFIHSGSDWSYPSIVAGGDRGTILHYHGNNQIVEDGELVLIDAGCEVGGYASDITRTYPINGKFTEPQREIYEAVLEAQRAAIETCVVGAPCDTPQKVAKIILAQRLIDLGVLSGEADDVIGSDGLGRWYMHNIGHWLGLDVHDVGVYFPGGEGSEARSFEEGMVMTIEPGLYFGAWRTDVEVPERYAGVGVRIEDNILITADGPIVLTADCPTSIEEIEALVGTDAE